MGFFSKIFRRKEGRSGRKPPEVTAPPPVPSPPPAPPQPPTASSSPASSSEQPYAVPNAYSAASSGPVDLDDTSQLEYSEDEQSRQLYTMPEPQFSAGQVPVHDESDAESSSFNLSTDADSEYESYKRADLRARVGAASSPQPEKLLSKSAPRVSPRVSPRASPPPTRPSPEKNSPAPFPIIEDEHKQEPSRMQILSVAKPDRNYGNVASLSLQAEQAAFPKQDAFADFADFSTFEETTPALEDLLAQAKSKRKNKSSRSVSDILKNLEGTKDSSDEEKSESWLMDEVTGALGPRGIAPDLESLSGRSNRSKSSSGGGRRRRRRHRSSQSGGESVDSHGSKRSHGSRRSRSSRYSTRSYLSQMSEQSRSVANDLLRLEMQLAMVGGSSNNNNTSTPTPSRRSRAVARRSRVTVVAPPGKLGIILANRVDSRGTVVSGVRTSSVLADKIAPGDRIVAIDGEDVSLMTVSEITTIMARKSDYERALTVLTTPRQS